MEFNFKKALKSQGFLESEVNELREKVKKFENVPKKLSSKKVRKKIL